MSFKYGLYLSFGDETDPFSNTKEVEGYLVLPGTRPIAVWGSFHYNGEELIEVLPIQGQEFNQEEADRLLKTILKRIRDRIEFIESLNIKRKNEEVK